MTWVVGLMLMLTVRIYSPISPVALNIVEDTFQAAGVQVVIEDCTAPGACLTSPTTHEVLLRVVPRRRGSGSLHAGQSVVDANGRGHLATIAFDIVAIRARGAVRLSLDDVLGIVAAHEIGHLLGLSHDPAGTSLMRHGLDLRRWPARSDWLFSEADAAAIREVVSR